MKKETKCRWLVLFLCCALLLGILPGIMPEARAAEVSYYGREQLAKLSNATALLYAYDQIVAGAEEAAEKIKVYNGTNSLSEEELGTVMDAYLRDHVEHFWVKGGYTYTTSGGTCQSIIPQYTMTGMDLIFARDAFDAAVSQILSGVRGDMSEFERELYLHDKLASLVTYANGTDAHNAYGALVNGTAVCDGYAEALQCLLHRAGIQSFIAVGQARSAGSQTYGTHAWNYVCIDGKYYQVDLTWNDQGKTLYHAYFNQTDRVMNEDHKADAAAFPLPSCTATDAMYFMGKDTYLQSCSVEQLGRLLKDNNLQVHVYLPTIAVSDFWNWVKENIKGIAKNAQVSGSYSYGNKSLGKEVVVTITPKNPQPEEPDPTESKTTEPQPTEPKSTEPVPTEPKPTEPKPTEPQPTEPVATEPQTTNPPGTEPPVTDPPATEQLSTEPQETEPPTSEPVGDDVPTPTDPSAGKTDGGSWKIVLIVLPAAVVAAGAIATPILLRKKKK